MTKFEATYQVVKKTADNMNVTIAESATAMQTTAAKSGKDELISLLGKVKLKSLGIEL